MRIATFNLQSLRLRRREGRPVLDGAVDQDTAQEPRSPELDLADRALTADVIIAARADIVALQEVFDLDTLDHFHDHFLLPAGAPAYRFRYCFPGNDGRGLNVAALCGERPSRAISHAGLTGADLGLTGLPRGLRDRRLFRRDCLELQLASLTLFICHFKAPYPDARKAYAIREAEARAVRKLVEARFASPERERWVILGDFNEPAGMDEPSPSSLDPLGGGFSVDLLDRLRPGTDWTYEVPGTSRRSRPDRMLASPTLAREYPDLRPVILRSGMRGSPRARSNGPVPAAAPVRPHASDHALVYADFPGL